MKFIYNFYGNYNFCYIRLVDIDWVAPILFYQFLKIINFHIFTKASRTQLRTNRHTRCTVVWNVGNSTKKSSNQFLSCCSYLTFKNNNYGKIQWRSNF